MKTNNETEWLDDLSLTSIFKEGGKYFSMIKSPSKYFTLLKTKQTTATIICHNDLFSSSLT